VADHTQTEGNSSEPEPYKVGHGRPPREHQFKPGQSGNPGGRKKGESLTAMLRKVLEREHNGRPIGELLVERLVKEALAGKLPHLKEVLDRVEGRAVERMKVDAQVRSPAMVILPIPLPQVTGNPEVDRLLEQAHAEQVKRGLAEAPEGAKILVGDCFLDA